MLEACREADRTNAARRLPPAADPPVFICGTGNAEAKAELDNRLRELDDYVRRLEAERTALLPP